MSEAAPWMTKSSLTLWIGGYAVLAVAVGVLIWWWFRPEFRNMVILVIGCVAAFVIFSGTMWSFYAGHQASVVMKRDGIKGSARVLQVESTNVLINRRPQVRMRLEVKLPGKPAYEQQWTDTIPLGQAVAPGRDLTVYLDRADGQRMMIDWEAPMVVAPAGAPAAPSSSSSASPSVSARLDELRKLRDDGQISEEEYRAHRERLLSEL